MNLLYIGILTLTIGTLFNDYVACPSDPRVALFKWRISQKRWIRNEHKLIKGASLGKEHYYLDLQARMSWKGP